MTNEKVSFLACVRHETKKAAKPYFINICWIICIIAGLYLALMGIVTYGAAVVAFISGGIGAIISLVVSTAKFILGGTLWVVTVVVTAVPWWLYVIGLLVSAPVIYAVFICIQKRYKVDIGCVAVFASFIYVVGFVIVATIGLIVTLGQDTELLLHAGIVTAVLGSLFFFGFMFSEVNGHPTWKLKEEPIARPVPASGNVMIGVVNEE